MKRYVQESADMIPVPDGEWVRWKDVELLISKRKRPKPTPPPCPNHPTEPPASPEHSPLCAECLLG